MRRTPVLLAVTALVAVGLVGCSSAADASCVAPSASPVFDQIQVSGSLDERPSVEMNVPFHVSETSASVVEAGDGPVLTSDEQTALVDVQVFNGSTGEEGVATRYSGDLANTPSLAQLATTFPGLVDALHCASEGSRVAVALSPEGVEPAALSSVGLEEGESVVIVADVRKVYLAQADGADQYTESHGLPTVVRAPDGRPGIIVPEATAPTEQVVQVIKRGDGEVVGDDDTARIHYTTVDWAEPRAVRDTTWDDEPAVVTADSMPAGLAAGVIGQTVGSQVLVVSPDSETGATLVYVVDILGVD